MKQKGFVLITTILIIGILALTLYFFVNSKSYKSAEPTISTPSPIQESSQPITIPTASTITNAVTGKVIIYSMGVDTMNVQFVAKTQAGNITQMMVWTDTNPNKQWQKFSTFLNIPVSGNVYAQYRDNLGNESQIYTDTTDPKISPPQQ